MDAEWMMPAFLASDHDGTARASERRAAQEPESDAIMVDAGAPHSSRTITSGRRA